MILYRSIRKYFSYASLVVNFIWTNFQVKIRVYEFSGKFEVLQENFSKPWISQPNLSRDPYTLRLFLVYMSPTWGQNMEPKTVDHLVTFPCKSYLIVSIDSTKKFTKTNGYLASF